MLESFLYTLMLYGIVIVSAWAFALVSPRK